MTRFRNPALLLTVSGMVLIAVACTTPGTQPATAPSTNIPTAVAPAATSTPKPTPTPLVDKSVYVPEIASVSTETIYEQSRRATLGGTDTFFWPDGNIGFIPDGSGKFRFFAANGDRTAVMVGTLDDPGATVEHNRLTIAGIDPQFPYAAGGPVYRDPDSGLLLLFYHAERHFGASIFHASLGLAASQDNGKTFQNLGIILENNAPPDPSAPCCADMAGAPYAIKDGQFLVYFRDRQKDLSTTELAVATAPVDQVIEAAKNGMVTPWTKYNRDGPQPGISGISSPLEVGNPPTDWFSVSYNTSINRYIMAILTHVRSDTTNYELDLTTSEDGYEWSPRVPLLDFHGEMAYPTIVDPNGDPFNTAATFYIYYVTTPLGVTRWHNTAFKRLTVKLSGQMLEPPHGWEFDADPEGWKPLNQMDTFDVHDGVLTIEASGPDPYMLSPTVGASTDTYKHIEVRMKVGQSGIGEFFFTTSETPNISGATSVRFPVTASHDFQTYTVDMSKMAAWKGRIGDLRFDPIDVETAIEIDYIRLVP